jgi:mono/diheme cytochrome c family protein
MKIKFSVMLLALGLVFAGASVWTAAPAADQTSAGATNQLPARAVTFHKDVLPIIQKNCQSCHRPGQIGPFSMLSYSEMRPWARAIKTAVVSRQMPPWFADPKHGRFSNDRTLKQADIDTIAAWVDGGAVEGDSKDAPAPVHWPDDGWEIPPDVIVKGVEIPVPATGIVEWMTVTVPSGFTKDTWVTSEEIQPGARSVVHHVCVSYRPPRPGVKYGVPEWPDKPRDANGIEIARPQRVQPGTPGIRRVDSSVSRGHCFVPGIAAMDYRPYNAAKLIPAGSDITFSLHYNPNGKAAVDLTRVGFTIAIEPPQRRYVSLTFNPPQDRERFAIPPNDPSWKAPSSEGIFLRDADLVSMTVHMHDRGKDATQWFFYPDGRSEIALHIPKYDFNWQQAYMLAEPIRIPKGTRARFDAHFNNTARRGYLNPDLMVYWGDQTWEEMMSDWLGLVIDVDADPYKVIQPLNGSTVAGAGEEG